MRFFLFGLLAFVAACGDGNPKRVDWDEFERYVSNHKIGSTSAGSDYWLQKQIGDPFNDEWANVVLVFGYIANGEVCDEFAVYLQTTYPTNKYRCLPANEYRRRTR